MGPVDADVAHRARIESLLKVIHGQVEAGGGESSGYVAASGVDHDDLDGDPLVENRARCLHQERLIPVTQHRASELNRRQGNIRACQARREFFPG